MSKALTPTYSNFFSEDEVLIKANQTNNVLTQLSLLDSSGWSLNDFSLNKKLFSLIFAKLCLFNKKDSISNSSIILDSFHFDLYSINNKTFFQNLVSFTSKDNLISNTPLPSLGEDHDITFFANLKTSQLTSTRKLLDSSQNSYTVGGLVHRLQITSAVILPSDYPIHLICGSRDVIHS